MYSQFVRLEDILEKLSCINIMFDYINEHFSVDLSLNNDKISEQYDNYMNIIEIMQFILFEQYKELYKKCLVLHFKTTISYFVILKVKYIFKTYGSKTWKNDEKT